MGAIVTIISGFLVNQQRNSKNMQRIEQLLAEIEEEGCTCDMMLGWSCAIHGLIRELEELINEQTE